MKAIPCDPAEAYLRLLELPDARPAPATSQWELWRIQFHDANAVGYKGKVLVQGKRQQRIADLLRVG